MKLTNSDAIPPTRSSEHAVGYDVYATKPLVLIPGTLTKIKLGFEAAFPPGWSAGVWDRSSYGADYIIRHAGLIDPDYRGEWAILLFNHGQYTKHIKKGERIAQIVFTRVGLEDAEIVDGLPATKRGSGGFGSTGA